ncbi:hypothetical protein ColTof4_07288 [Colletotrichum tofieldiae]|uniref:C2H2-type domain-containing protein n=1 Tax=Colletotrichum tofieldiae TaxID=708197 RepID=A0A161YF79_9PEZI|nr:hypothetical protein CT0861_04810 [Colletotrichum tofieldiae]GKT64890.1 hypothetical protein ColTof3_12229 [Colletotrichum tofieldiae]GKT74865.1 hypothetical protein ColTof4_07288 [Colletotrichum tofieldiae]
MDHHPLRAGRVHVDDCFTYHAPPARGNHHAPLDVSYNDLPHLDLGHYAYASELDLLEADAAPAADLAAESPSQYPQPALDAQQVDPRQVWAEVYDNLQPRISILWDPVAANADYLAPQAAYAIPGSTATPSQTEHSQFDTSYLGPRPIAPSTWDGVSTHSGYTNNSSSSNICTICGTPVNSRLMQRHHQDVHRQDDDPQYACKCAYRAPPARKWNYLRHLDKCKMKDDSRRVFTCICQKTLNNLQAHLGHVKDCGKKRAGRRPNSARIIK